MDRTFALAGAVSAFIAVAAGAFGSHALRARLPPDSLEVFLFSGSLYALALTSVGWFAAGTPVGGLLFLAGWIALIVGIAKGGPAP